ncbi:MAG: CsbD family protein [Acidobacteria bacterium]|nr:MAG: CsbD family protein [Acidobacteriota bacterium]
MWNKDEVRGKVDQAKGSVKESVGKARNDEDLRNEGEADRIAGNIEEGFGKGRRKVGEAIKDLGDKLGK